MNGGTCYILGSGSSLLELAEGQVRYLNAHAQTLSMNKYLMFHQRVGVVPRAHFIADIHYPAHLVFFKTVRAARRLRERPWLYVNRYYTRFLEPRLWAVGWGLRERYRVLMERRRLLPLCLPYSRHSGFRVVLKNDRPLRWAESFDDELYFYRGSLTTAMNVATIAFPRADTLVLLGVDLDRPEAFYEDAYDAHPELKDRYHEIGLRSERHPTAVQVDGVPGILSVMPDLVALLAERSVRVVCGNPNSLLVTGGICPHREIPSI